MPSTAWAETSEQVVNPLSEELVTEYILDTNGEQQIPLDAQTSIPEEIDILNAFGYDDSTVTGATISEGDIVYHSQIDAGKYGLVEADISVNESLSGNVELSFTEGSIEDILLITSDGKYFHNGQEILLIHNSELALEGSAFYRMTNVPPGCGVASDYTVTGGSYYKYIYLNNLICRTSVSLMATLIAGILSAGASIYGQLAAGATGTIAGNVVAEAVVTDGDVVKIKCYRYYSKKTSAFMVNSSMGCQRENSYFLNEDNDLITNGYFKSYWLYLMTGA